MAQKLRIREVVENWAIWRDRGDWDAFRTAWSDAEFRGELDRLLKDYTGRPSPLT